jgi:hypothetical protein
MTGINGRAARERAREAIEALAASETDVDELLQYVDDAKKALPDRWSGEPLADAIRRALDGRP